MLLPLGGLEGRPEVRLGGEGGGDLEEEGGGGVRRPGFSRSCIAGLLGEIGLVGPISYWET